MQYITISLCLVQHFNLSIHLLAHAPYLLLWDVIDLVVSSHAQADTPSRNPKTLWQQDDRSRRRAVLDFFCCSGNTYTTLNKFTTTPITIGALTDELLS